MEPTCHRCNGTLVEGMPYCPHCGAPQLTINNYEQPPSSAMEAAEMNAGLGSRSPGAGGTGVDWHAAVPAALQVALAGGGLMLLASVAPMSATLALLWIFAAALMAVALYHRRSPKSLITAGVGARIGTVVGLFLTAVMVTLNAAELMTDRYLLHQGDQITSAIQSAITQSAAMSLQIYKNAGVTDPQEMAAIKSISDYWMTPGGMATMKLLDLGMISALVLGFCVLTGALSGRLMPRRQNPV